jgi:hypothetical protein
MFTRSTPAPGNVRWFLWGLGGFCEIKGTVANTSSFYFIHFYNGVEQLSKRHRKTAKTVKQKIRR